MGIDAGLLVRGEGAVSASSPCLPTALPHQADVEGRERKRTLSAREVSLASGPLTGEESEALEEELSAH